MQTTTSATKLRQFFQSADSTELTLSCASGLHSNRQVARSAVARWRSWTVRSFAMLMAVTVITGPNAFGQTTGGRGNGGGGDIVVFDIDGVAPAASKPCGCVIDTDFIILGAVPASSRPAGGNGGDGDIVVFDINGVAPATSPPASGPGGGDFVDDFIIIGPTSRPRSSSSNQGGGDFTDDFVILGIVDDAKAAFWCVVNTDVGPQFGILALGEQIEYSNSADAGVASGLLWSMDGGPVPILIRLQIRY